MTGQRRVNMIACVRWKVPMCVYSLCVCAQLQFNSKARTAVTSTNDRCGYCLIVECDKLASYIQPKWRCLFRDRLWALLLPTAKIRSVSVNGTELRVPNCRLIREGTSEMVNGTLESNLRSGLSHYSDMAVCCEQWWDVVQNVFDSWATKILLCDGWLLIMSVSGKYQSVC